MHLACTYVNCSLTLLILSSLVPGETDFTHDTTKNAKSDTEQKGTCSEHTHHILKMGNLNSLQ